MQFRNEYYFLSNMYPCKITFILNDKSYTFLSAESAYQACKSPVNADMFCNLNGYEAKKLGRKLPLRTDWDIVKFDIMKIILNIKFQNPELLHKLLNIRGEIVEENNWGDYFWGKCNGVGQNNLGKILMSIRDKEEKY